MKESQNFTAKVTNFEKLVIPKKFVCTFLELRIYSFHGMKIVAFLHNNFNSLIQW